MCQFNVPATRSVVQVRQDTLSDLGLSQPLRTLYCLVQRQIPLRESTPVVSAVVEGRERTG
jgi:hypothetical protein